MSTPHYRAVKVGDNYVLRRVDSEHQAKVVGGVVGGALLTVCGLRRGSLMGLLVAAGGAGLSYYAYTGKNPVKAITRKIAGCQSIEGTASHHHDDEMPASRSQTPQDAIDEAAMESFPASDPPAHSVTTEAAR